MFKKQKKYLFVGVIAVLAALIATTLTTNSALAHEKRKVGNYTFIVGFLNEPAYANQLNSIDLTICEGAECLYGTGADSTKLTNPVIDADKVLKVTVSQGGNAPIDLPLKARWGNAGKYSSYFVPTAVGAYSFHITGTLKSDTINETFTSGPNTFGEADQVTLYPSGSQNTTTSSTDLQQQVKDAQTSASNATYFGIGGGVLGLVGLIVAAIALARKPKAATSPASKVEQDDLRG